MTGLPNVLKYSLSCHLCTVSYPPAFGDVPRMQTRDLRPLPFGYGMGSGTLANWLARQAEAVYGETVDEYRSLE